MNDDLVVNTVARFNIFDEITRLRSALLAAKIGHYECEDGWYSCPKSEHGCLNDQAGKDCTCGADRHNAAIDAALGETGE